MLARWAREPQVAAAALLLERRCLALNERVQLFGRHAAIDLVTSHGLDEGLANVLTAGSDGSSWPRPGGLRWPHLQGGWGGETDALSWHDAAGRRLLGGAISGRPSGAVVGRQNQTAFRAALAASPVSLYEVRRIIHGKGAGWRSVRVQATGTDAAIAAALRRAAEKAGTVVRLDRHGIARAHVLERQPGYPAVEHFYVAASAGARDKERPGFAPAWNRLVTHPQHALF